MIKDGLGRFGHPGEVARLGLLSALSNDVRERNVAPARRLPRAQERVHLLRLLG